MTQPGHLFVYGTLRRAFGHPMHQLIASAADPAGDAVAPGTLYDLGPYPGLWLGDTAGPGVRGEAYRLHPARAAETLRRLDDYEGVRQSEVAGCVYRREALEVVGDGWTAPAWVYVLNALPAGATAVEGGDYLAWTASR